MNVAIIPARGGSQRIPRKNLKRFYGKPIIEYSIEAALGSRLFSDVYVSTDDSDIMEVAITSGAAVLFRDPVYADNDVGTQDVVWRHLHDLWPAAKCAWRLPNYACCIYATAPMMTARDLAAGFKRLQETGKPYVYSVDSSGRDAGQWYWGQFLAFYWRVPLDDKYVTKHRIPNNRVCDINTPEDWARAEEMYACLPVGKPNEHTA